MLHGVFDYVNHDMIPMLAMELFGHRDAPKDMIYGVATRLNDYEALASAALLLHSREESGEEGNHANRVR